MGHKEERVRDGILKHLEATQRCVVLLQDTVSAYLAGDASFKKIGKKLDEVESEADHIRKETERILFEGAFLPIHRQDYYTLLERLDEVADKSDDAAKLLSMTQPTIPAEAGGDLRRITEETCRMADIFHECVQGMFEDVRAVEKRLPELKEAEHTIDELQYQTVKKIYKMPIDKADKLLLKDVVDSLAQVSDMMEDVGDFVGIVLIRRLA